MVKVSSKEGATAQWQRTQHSTSTSTVKMRAQRSLLSDVVACPLLVARWHRPTPAHLQHLLEFYEGLRCCLHLLTQSSTAGHALPVALCMCPTAVAANSAGRPCRRLRCRWACSRRGRRSRSSSGGCMQAGRMEQLAQPGFLCSQDHNHQPEQHVQAYCDCTQVLQRTAVQDFSQQAGGKGHHSKGEHCSQSKAKSGADRKGSKVRIMDESILSHLQLSQHTACMSCCSGLRALATPAY